MKFKALTITLLLLAVIDNLYAQEFGQETIFLCATDTYYEDIRNYYEVCNNTCDDRGFPFNCPDEGCGDCDKYMEKLDANAPIIIKSENLGQNIDFGDGVIITVPDKTKFSFEVTDPNWFGETVVRSYAKRTEETCENKFAGFCIDYDCVTRDPDIVRDYVIKRYRKNFRHYADIVDQTIVATKNLETGSVNVEVPVISNEICTDVTIIGMTFTICVPINDGGAEYDGLTTADQYKLEILKGGSWQVLSAGLGAPSGNILTDIDGLEFGQYAIRFRQRSDCNGDVWWTQSGTIDVVPSCYNDNTASLGIAGAFNLGPKFPNAYLVEEPGTFPIVLTGLTDFDQHYEMTLDGETEYIQLDAVNQTITVSNDIPNVYKLFINRKEGRASCLGSVPENPGDDSTPIATLTIMVNGEPLVQEQLCPIVLPDDLLTAGDSEDNIFITEIFPVKAISGRSVIVKPGMILSSGATLTTKAGGIDEALPLSNEEENYVLQKSYDVYGRMTGAGITYFDALGRPEQQQYIDIGSGQLMASENYYDGYGRGLLSSLTAPIGTNIADEECPEFPIDESGWVAFEKKENFAPLQSGATLRSESIEDGRVVSPVKNTVEGTLGHYYSTGSPEKLVANTAYPLVQAVPENNGTGAIRSQVPPGDFYRQPDGTPHHIASTVQHLVSLEEGAGDRALIDDYLALHAKVFPARTLSISNLTNQLTKSEFTDADNRKSYVYKDRAGMSIISVVETESGLLSAFNFYDTKSRLVAQITPNGVQQNKLGTAYEDIDKSTYQYNFEGFLISTTSKDGGRSEYRYAKDGRIRFSQNAQQRIEGSFSYTHYDGSTRPVESGEFTPSNADYAFDGANLLALLDKLEDEGNLPGGSGEKQYISKTAYDLPQEDYPLAEQQQFVMGAVAASEYYSKPTEKPDHKTYYSYDERGRLVQMVQDIKGLGIKTIAYTYGPAGNVKEVAYQAGSDDEYYHYYEYDKDSRLATVYSGTVAPAYNSQLEITNKEEMVEQASYEYYLHGPLKRVLLTQANQGMDYLYTVDGKLKAINSADPMVDPGEDEQDVFGMVLNYHPEDYKSAQITDLGQSSFPDAAQYSGNIQAQEWHSPVDGNQKKAYSYSYDQRQQLKSANFGSTPVGTFMDEGKYDVTISGYDANGNIEGLNRTDENGNTLHSLTYVYAPESNRLLRVMQDGSVMNEYTYNAIGQLISQTSGFDKLFVDYEVSGKVETVYANEARTDTVMHIQYDDKGFRLSKTAYDDTYQAQFKTWYVRDASGTVMNIYIEALQSEEEPMVYETPVYGSGRLGAYRPALSGEGGSYYYEIKDHLGNVRVVIGCSDIVTYLATMEDERAAEEIQYFSGITSTTVGTHLNHTPESTVAGASRAVRINNVLAGAAKQPIGGGINLRVFPGDTVKAKIQAKYLAATGTETNVIPMLAGYLATAFGLPLAGEGVSNIFEVTDQASFAGLAAWDEQDENQPNIYLNYLLYDDDFNLIDFGFKQVSEQARIPTDENAMATHSFEELSVEVTAKKPGFVYIYFSNEDERNVTAYFDDMEVKHVYGNIAVATDSYPFGLAMESRKLERKYWRYGYQGEYAEKDEETNWNAFQLRMYDPVIGRWLSTDPYGQYPSPYLGMGNDPMMRFDPDGGTDILGNIGSFFFGGYYENSNGYGSRKGLFPTIGSEIGAFIGGIDLSKPNSGQLIADAYRNARIAQRNNYNQGLKYKMPYLSDIIDMSTKFKSGVIWTPATSSISGHREVLGMMVEITIWVRQDVKGNTYSENNTDNELNETFVQLGKVNRATGNYHQYINILNGSGAGLIQFKLRDATSRKEAIQRVHYLNKLNNYLQGK